MYTKNLTSGDDTYAGDEGAPDNADLVHGGAGNDQISGGLDADALHGDDGDDLLNGGAGDDILDGGDGDDTAVFSGAAGDYVWSGDTTSATITGPDGTDTLTHVEHLKFGSTIIDLPAPNTAPGAPTDGDAAANTVAEGAANGTVVAGLALAAVDPDAGQTLTYSLLDNAGGRFAINAATGVVTVADATLLNFETAASHQITVQVSDGTATSSASFTINVANAAPTAPTDLNASANTIAESAANGDLVGLTVGATDVNGGAVTYSLSDDAGGRFAIDAATGVVSVADATKLNFETAASHQITVRAADAQGAASTQTFSIAVTNVAPTAPTDANAGANTVSEGAANGDAVGLTVGATDANGGTLSYSLLDNAGGRFAINATTGVVTVANAGLLNFETATSHQITVQASDGAATSSASFTIDVSNVAPGAPTDSNAAANTVSEAAVNGTVVAGLTIGTAEPNGGVTYSLVDDAGGRFAINAATGVVTVADGSLLDYEVAASHQIIVHAADGSGGADATFTINVANAPPTQAVDTDATVNTVMEGSANGVLVGITASATEPKTGTVAYSLSDDAGGRFAIDAATGVVSVADGTKLNFEVAASHQITVRATDGQGAFSSQVFTIAVGNAPNGMPVDGNAAANTISEGAVNGDVVAGLAISAPDVNDGPLVYSLLDDAGGRFTINAATGVVSVANASLLNFEAAASHQITVKAASGAESASASFVVNVTNAAPVITDSNGAANTVTESAANGTVVTGITIAPSDPHGGAVTYSLTNNAGGRFALNTTTGVVTVLNGTLLDHDTQSSHTITVQASDGLLTTSTDFVITLIDKIDSFWTGTTAANSFSVPDVQDWQMDGGAGNDTLNGGVGDDIFLGGAGDDTLSGGAGNDTFFVGQEEGFDAYNGGDGFDTIKTNAPNVYIGIKSLTAIEAISNNGYGGLTLTGTIGNDTLDFTNVTITGVVQFLAGTGNDTIIGSSGNDNMFGEAGIDTLRGGAGNDTLNGGSEVDTLYGDDGNDLFYAGTGDDLVFGGNGDDIFQIAANEGVDSYDGGAGFDTILVVENNTTIGIRSITGIEAISLNGKFGVNIIGSALADTLDFTNVSMLWTPIINGAAGDDTITGTTGADNIVGDVGNDILNGGLGNDRLDGMADNDTLNGGDGDDILIGSGGNDVMNGGNGDDTFLIWANAGVDAFDGGAGYDTIKASENNVVIGFSSVKNVEAFSNGGFSNVSISGGTGDDIMDFSTVGSLGGMIVYGAAGNDTITGTETADTLRGDAGADTIRGMGGDDNIDGGADGDSLYGGEGADTIVGGAGGDAINGDAGNDTLGGDDGDDTINGGDGNDTITGGVGNDTISGGNGDDTFLFGVNSGIDRFNGGAGYDVIKASADNAAFTYSWSLDGIEAISSGGFKNVQLVGTTGADNFDLRGGIVVEQGIVISMGAGDDAAYGTADADILRGDAGADMLNGMAGNDVIDGGTGNDNLYGADGDDIFLVGLTSGIDSFDGGAGYDIIKATADNTVFTFSQPIQLVAIEAISAGGFKNVTIVGTTGNDDMNFSGLSNLDGMPVSAGAGNDSINGSQGADVIKGDAGLDTIWAWGGNDNVDGGADADGIDGGDGDDTLFGGAGVDSLAGGNGDDILDGGTENDTLYGNDGNDTITGGAGNDTLLGGAGDDVFLIGLSAGTDAFDGGLGYDVIRATANNVVIGFSSLAGIEAFSAGGFTGVTIAGSTGNDDMNFSGLISTGGLIIDGLAGNDTITGTNGIDTLKGGAGNDVIYALDGADLIDGGTGVDSLYGGGGDDIFLVGVDTTLGADSFDGGLGTDTIQATANNVTMYVAGLTGIEVISSGGFTGVTLSGSAVADNLDFSNVTFVGSVVVNGLAGNDTIIGGGGVDTFRGGDGNDTISGGAGADLLYGDAGADTLNGGDGDDILDGGTEVDSLNGGAGDDILIAGRYQGTDAFDGGAGFDEIRANVVNATIWFSSLTSIEKISSGGFANAQIGVEVFSTLANWDFSNIQLEGIAMISGGLQNDTIIGSAGDDYLYGSAGADVLKGGAGDDLFGYRVFENATYDTVDGGDGWDKLIAGATSAVIQIATMTNIEEISSGGYAGVVLSTTTLADTLDLRGVVVTGAVSINLNGGDDVFYGSSGADTVDGYTGNDIIDTGDGDDIIQVQGNNGVDIVHGGAGYDKMVGVGGVNINISSTFDGIEEVVGNGIASTKIAGTVGNDFIDMRGVILTNIQYIWGDLGDDEIHGSYGDDFIMGDRGFDKIYGEAGNDKIWFTAYGDTDEVDGGDGYDTLVAWNDGVIIGFNKIVNIEAISGEGHANVGIAFTDGNDNFDLTNIAVTGVAYIDLKAGDDIFVGSTSADRIIGGAGSDTMTGGAGADIFDYNAVAEGNWDIITDFVSGVDKIDLSTIDAVPVGGGGGNEAFAFLGTGAFTHTQGQLRYTVTSDGVVFSGDWNGDGVADFNVTVLGVSSLSAADFIL